MWATLCAVFMLPQDLGRDVPKSGNGEMCFPKSNIPGKHILLRPEEEALAPHTGTRTGPEDIVLDFKEENQMRKQVALKVS